MRRMSSANCGSKRHASGGEIRPRPPGVDAAPGASPGGVAGEATEAAATEAAGGAAVAATEAAAIEAIRVAAKARATAAEPRPAPGPPAPSAVKGCSKT